MNYTFSIVPWPTFDCVQYMRCDVLDYQLRRVPSCADSMSLLFRVVQGGVSDVRTQIINYTQPADIFPVKQGCCARREPTYSLALISSDITLKESGISSDTLFCQI